MTVLPSHPQLRLVGDTAVADSKGKVTRENLAAARNPELDPLDPRWVLAARAYSQLQGTAMPWEGRQRVLRTAGRLGVRPFDANLVIAIVQDNARRGRDLSETAGPLALLPPTRPRSVSREWIRWTAALAAAAVANVFLIWWLTG